MSERQGSRRRRIGRRIRQIRVPGYGVPVGLVVAVILIAGGYLLWRSPSMQPEANASVRFFQIATGSTAGTYYPVGELIATMISEPLGGEPCNAESRCGVPGLLAVVKSSQGSIDNVRTVSAGTYDAAMAQADVTWWAYRGEGVFGDAPPLDNLRAIAGLYSEAVHLVAARDSEIASVRDLAGKRVSVDRPGSGTRADAMLILRAFGLSDREVNLADTGPAEAVDLMAAGQLDAFFLVAGTPAAAVTELVRRGLAKLVPIEGPEVETLQEENRFFLNRVIPEGTYRGIGPVRTVAVNSLLLTSAEKEASLIHDITAALWRPGNRALLENGHAKGREIRLETALDGVPIPFHPGAERYYREAGLM